jgi:uncharacterized protein YcbX
MEISQLYIYPIKSLGGIALKSSLIEERGLRFDRRWMLVDETNCFLTQRTLPVLSSFDVVIAENSLLVINKTNQNSISVPFLPKSNIYKKVKVWDDEVNAEIVDESISEWFSEQLYMKADLVFQHDNAIRKIDSKYAINGLEHTSFSDGYPILIISEASLALLNSKCSEKISMERFRPNIVLKDCEPFFEDSLKAIKINDVELHGVKPCARCIVPTLNPQTQKFSKEPLLTLSKFRKFDSKILFGQNAVVHQIGEISIGDKISIS